jgi:hypothetical protein
MFSDKIFSMKRIPSVILPLILVIFFAFFTTQPMETQSGLRLELSEADLSQFPKVTFYLDVYDSRGNFVNDLTLRNMTLMEDGQNRIVNETFLTQPGLDAIVAINLSPTLSNRSSSGATRFQDLNAALMNWINYLPVTTEMDRYTLTGNEGVLVERNKERSAFTQALQGYQPNLFNLKPTLASLESALVIAAKGSPVQYSKQAIFYLTALPVESELQKIPTLIQQANQLKVPIFVWLVAADASENSQAALSLTELAQKTGGRFFLYGESKQPPNPEEYFQPLRYTYRVRYTSAVKESGNHRVSVQVQRGDQKTLSAEIEFSIKLGNPIPELVNAPQQLTRDWVADANANLVLQPDLIILQTKVNFPDGYPRQLKSSRLLVDGQVIIQNAQPPFEYFGWPLRNYRNSGEHTVQVEVEDILGYKGKSIAITIPITVAAHSTSFLAQVMDFLSNGGWLIPVGLLLAAGIHYAYRRRDLLVKILENRKAEKERETYDPLTQPVSAGNGEMVGGKIEGGGLPTVHYGQSVVTPPRLIWAGSQQAANEYQIIDLTQPEMTIGRDAKQCQIILKLPTIEKVHAVITLSADGHARVANRSEKNGTRVNYAPLSTAGTILHAGDLIHFGQIAFRYEIGGHDSGLVQETT